MAKQNQAENLKVTLVRSISGRSQKHQATVRCLGLRKIHQSVVVPNNPGIKGMINSVFYLVRVEEV
jgi:large subunit ribosomal protein L30